MYAKIRSSLWDGTLMGTAEVWAVFVFLLAKCDAEGFVDIHPRVISALTGFSEERVVSALAALQAADPESRSKELSGARIELLDEHREWGWRVVNYVHYRTTPDMETVRTQNRERVRRHRERKSDVTLPVTVGNGPSRQEEVEADADIESTHLSSSDDVTELELAPPEPRRAKRRAPGVSPLDAEWAETFHEVFWPEWLALGRECSKAAAFDAWQKTPHPDGQTDFDRLHAAFVKSRDNWAAAQTLPRFIPHAATWLNDYHKNLLIGA